MMQLGFAAILDRASSELLPMEERNHFPSELRVSSEMFALLARVRQSETKNGLPLLLLGIPVKEQADLSADQILVVK